MRAYVEKLMVVLLLVATLLQATGCCNRQSNNAGNDVAAKKAAAISKPGDKPAAVNRPAELLDKNGLNYSIDAAKTAKKANNVSNSFFEKQYLQGVELMEKGEYTKAIELFDELIKRYPSGEEASIAELCIAELYFRSKSNDRALKAYERIVANYPDSHAAENARAGIDYLQNFEKYEQEYVSPDVEGRKRRGY